MSIVKFTLIHPDDFIKEIPSFIKMIVQEYKLCFMNLMRDCQSIIDCFKLYLDFTLFFINCNSNGMTLTSILFSSVKMSENTISH